MIVNTPKTVPKGMKRHSTPPITRQNVWFFRLVRNRPVARMQPAKIQPITMIDAAILRFLAIDKDRILVDFARSR